MVLPTSDEHLIFRQGLSTAQAAQRLREDGPNALPDDQRRTLRAIVGETLREPMFMLLIAAGTLYLVLGDLHEGLILFALVLVVLGMTLYQEGKTERAIAALRDLSSPRALVLRDGQPQRIAGADVVLGDILLLAEGDRIAADARLISASELQVDESLLTGEAAPVSKVADAMRSSAGVARPGGDGLPWIFSGTLVVKGHASAQVTATGARSEIGRIGSALQTLTSEPSPLKAQTARLVRLLALIAFIASAALGLAFGLMRGDWMAALLTGIALAMAMLPQEFTVVLTVLPALGAWRLSAEKVLTRRIAAIETLGAVSVLCVDKTGTLTENQMTVAQLYVPDDLARPGPTLTIDYASQTDLPEAFHALVEFSILASVTDPFDPMEKAFHRLGQHFLRNTEHLHHDWTLVQEYGLTPELRAMSHVWKSTSDAAQVVAAKGAPEAIMDLCHLDPQAQAQVAAASEAMAAQGLRVLGVARARFQGERWPAIEHDFEFEFAGLLGLADPLRAEVVDAIAQCRAADIRIVMITGDYPSTALAIGRQAGLIDAMNAQADSALLVGETIQTLTDAQLRARLKHVSVCARIAPTQKLRIVQALKANGSVVAMTGDGVNDAAALKAAHVGVAMGERGTDVAREAAALVLLDDNFASIVRAVRLGRRIFDNLRKSMSYILAVHVPIAGMALLPVLLGWPVMLFPLHIAFLELVIDPACSLVFEDEPSEADVMQRPPRDASAALLAGTALWLALLQGAGVLLVVLAASAWGVERMSENAARTFAFVTLVSANLALIFSNRSATASLWALMFRRNRTLWLVTGLTLALLALVLYVPALAQLFLFGTLAPPELMLALALGMAAVFWFEAIKYARRWNAGRSG